MAVWVSMWIVFLIRPYFKQELFKTYKDLLPLSLEEKRAYVTGKEFYDYLMSCKELMDAGSAYAIAGLEKNSIESRRAAYYMYPNIMASGADFMLVYKSKNIPKDGYLIFKEFGPDKYLLRKVR